MMKGLYLLVLILLVRTLNAQTPRIRINSFLQGSGTVSVRVWSPTTGYDYTMHYDLGTPYQNQDPEIPSPPAGNNYSILVTNHSNQSLSFVLTQTGVNCDASRTRYTNFAGPDYGFVDLLANEVMSGQSFYIAKDTLKIRTNASYGQVCTQTTAQNSYQTGELFVNLFSGNGYIRLQPIRYIDRVLYFSSVNENCVLNGQFKVYVNGNAVSYTPDFLGYGLAFLRLSSSTELSVGDEVWGFNQCTGQISNVEYPRDVFAYLEVKDGFSHTGNRITPTYSLPPYGLYTTPVEVNQCTPVKLSSHVLYELGLSNSGNNDNTYREEGPYKINGQLVQESEMWHGFVPPNAGTYIQQGKVFTNNGLISWLTRQPRAAPVKWEVNYRGIVGNDEGDNTFYMNGSGFAQMKDDNYDLFQTTYSEHDLPKNKNKMPTSNPANYTLEATKEGVIRFWHNGVKIDSLVERVKFEVLGGKGLLSEMGSVPYGKEVVFTPQDTGYYYVKATFNGQIAVKQLFHVKSNPPKLSVGDTLKVVTDQQVMISITNCAGTVKWDDGSTGSFIQFSAKESRMVTASCQPETGCFTKTVQTYVQVKPPKPTVQSSLTDVCENTMVTFSAGGCTGQYLWSNGASGNQITLVATQPQLLWVKCQDTAGTSDPKFIQFRN